MYNRIIDKLNNKNIAILGFGKEGQSTYNFIRRHLKDIKLTIIDGNASLLEKTPFLKDDKNLNLVLGDNYLDGLNNYDLIIKTAGISLKDIDTTDIKQKLTSQFGLLLEDTDAFVIGITASKGKSTTTTLVYNILKDQNKDCYLLGNMGNPPLDVIESIDKNSILVVEMAALQLEYIRKSPHIGSVLNLYEEHLDYFGTKKKYFDAKMNMFKYQDANDFGFYLKDNLDIDLYLNNNKYESKLYGITLDQDINNISNNTIYINNNKVYIKEHDNIKELYDINTKTNLLGNHNLQNIMFALGIANLLNLDMSKVTKTIENFQPLEHRMEKIGTYNNVTYYNDAIATIPVATINCIDALKNVNTLIFGGKDRKIDYYDFINYLNDSEIQNFICMPDTGFLIGKKLNKTKNVFYASSMEEAVNIAKKVTKENTICVLSPAASSYNMFKNFEEKGTTYKNLVKQK